LETLGRRNQ